MTTITNDTPESEALRVAIDRQALGLRTATPGIVVSVDSQGRTVDVQPATSMRDTTTGKLKPLQLPIIRGVPLHVLGSTSLGLFVAVPLVPGDEGLLVICDRALDNWQHGEGVQMTPDAESPRHHDIIDATFWPGLQRMSGAIADYPTDAIEIRNRAGGAVLSVSADAITSTVGEVSMTVSAAGVDIAGSIRVNGVNIGENHTHPHGDQAGNTGGVNP